MGVEVEQRLDGLGVVIGRSTVYGCKPSLQ
jgi:hypothetical protein